MTLSTLYIDRQDLRLRVDSGCVRVGLEGTPGRSIPLAHLERIVLRARTHLDSGTLGQLAHAGVEVVGLSGRHGRRMFQIPGRGPRTAGRRIGQYRLSDNTDMCLAWGRILIGAKIQAQAALLQEAALQRAEHRRALLLGAKRVEGALIEVVSAADVGSLRGIEGAAASAYFQSFVRLFPPSLGFSGRNRRPPRDPVNAALSLAYTLLQADAVNACHTSGLDPMLGFYHAPAYGRDSLACDLVEPLRARTDRWVWGLFRNRTLREEAFLRDKGACLLGKAGRSRFYEEYEVVGTVWRRYLRQAARRVALALEPLVPDWSCAEEDI